MHRLIKNIYHKQSKIHSKTGKAAPAPSRHFCKILLFFFFLKWALWNFVRRILGWTEHLINPDRDPTDLPDWSNKKCQSDIIDPNEVLFSGEMVTSFLNHDVAEQHSHVCVKWLRGYAVLLLKLLVGIKSVVNLF